MKKWVLLTKLFVQNAQSYQFSEVKTNFFLVGSGTPT